MVFAAVMVPNSAVIVVCPSPIAVTRPSALIVTTLSLPDVHRVVDVRSIMVPSAYVTKAESRSVSPLPLRVVAPLIVMPVTAGGTAACGGGVAAVGAVGNVDDVFPPQAPIPTDPIAKTRAKAPSVGLLCMFQVFPVMFQVFPEGMQSLRPSGRMEAMCRMEPER